MESKAKKGESSDDERFEDAESVAEKPDNEAIITELIGKHDDLTLGPNIEDKEEIQNDTDVEKDHDEKYLDCDDDLIDDESQREIEKDFTEEQKQANKALAEGYKKEGNDHFKNGEYEKSCDLYTLGLKSCPVVYENERSILYANRAAAKAKLNFKLPAIEDCTKALEFNPKYLKALLRRATLYEESDKLDESLEDFKKILELDPSNADANAALIRLPPKIQERNENLKTEMLGKLKDLGNMFLKPFGLSTENFQMQQDPQSGSYSINFNQKK